MTIKTPRDRMLEIIRKITNEYLSDALSFDESLEETFLAAVPLIFNMSREEHEVIREKHPCDEWKYPDAASIQQALRGES